MDLRKYNALDKCHEGRAYQVSKKEEDSDIIYLRCKNHHICPGTAKTEDFFETIVPTKPHNDEVCDKDENLEIIARFRTSLKQMVRKNYLTKLKEVYNNAEALMRDLNVSELVPWKQIKGTMRRWRKETLPPPAKSLDDFINQKDTMTNIGILKYAKKNSFSIIEIMDDNNQKHILMIDKEWVADIECQFLMMDATYATKPALVDCYQLFIIMGVSFNCGIPLGYVLMSSKTTQAYNAVLKEFSNHYDTSEVSVIMADFELAIRSAAVTVIPDARMVGCNVHFDRAIYHYILTHGLKTALSDPDCLKTIRMLLALPYLPAAEINYYADYIMRSCSENTKTVLKNFFIYFRRQWLQVVGAQGISVYGLLRRTNNMLESFNAVLSRNITKNPDSWNFIHNVVKIQNDIIKEYDRIKSGKTPLKLPRYKTMYKEEVIKTAWRLQYLKAITPMELLEIVGSIKGEKIVQKINALEPIMKKLSEKYAEDLDQLHLRYDTDDPEFHIEIDSKSKKNKNITDLRDELKYYLNKVDCPPTDNGLSDARPSSSDNENNEEDSSVHVSVPDKVEKNNKKTVKPILESNLTTQKISNKRKIKVDHNEDLKKKIKKKITSEHSEEDSSVTVPVTDKVENNNKKTVKSILKTNTPQKISNKRKTKLDNNEDQIKKKKKITFEYSEEEDKEKLNKRLIPAIKSVVTVPQDQQFLTSRKQSFINGKWKRFSLGFPKDKIESEDNKNDHHEECNNIVPEENLNEIAHNDDIGENLIGNSATSNNILSQDASVDYPDSDVIKMKIKETEEKLQKAKNCKQKCKIQRKLKFLQEKLNDSRKSDMTLPSLEDGMAQCGWCDKIFNFKMEAPSHPCFGGSSKVSQNGNKFYPVDNDGNPIYVDPATQTFFYSWDPDSKQEILEYNNVQV